MVANVLGAMPSASFRLQSYSHWRMDVSCASAGLECEMIDRLFSNVSARVAGWAGQPVAFVLALVIIVGWGLTGPVFGYSDTWQLVINTGTTIVTFLMVFLIQNAQNRDAAAIQVKLDEIIRALDGARNDFIGIEHLSDTELRRIRDALEAVQDEEGRTARVESLSALITRR